jgi:hypothetical protein
MLPFTNFALTVKHMDAFEHESLLPETRGALLAVFVPVALVGFWAVVLLR